TTRSNGLTSPYTALRLLPRETGISRASLLPDAILFRGLHERISAPSVSRHTTEDTPALMFADRSRGRRTRQRRRALSPQLLISRKCQDRSSALSDMKNPDRM